MSLRTFCYEEKTNPKSLYRLNLTRIYAVYYCFTLINKYAYGIAEAVKCLAMPEILYKTKSNINSIAFCAEQA